VWYSHSRNIVLLDAGVEIKHVQVKVVRYFGVSEKNVCECAVGSVKGSVIESLGEVNSDEIRDREAQ